MIATREDSRRFEQSVVNAELSHWGFWKGLQYAADGYAPANTLAQIMSGRTENPGHRVLCLDMPKRAWEVNSVVMRLPTDYIAVLIARYCLPVDPATGRPYEIPYLAGLLEISIPTYRQRLYYARTAYRIRVFGQ